MTELRESGSPRAPVDGGARGGPHPRRARLRTRRGARLRDRAARAGGRRGRLGGAGDASGAGSSASPGPGRLEESEPYPLRIVLRRTLVPPPGGELIDPLLDRAGPGRAALVAGGWSVTSGWRAPGGAAGAGAPGGPRPARPLAAGARLGARPASSSSCRGSTRCAGTAPGSEPRGQSSGLRAGRATPPRAAAAWRSSRSTGCAPTARAARRRGSTGPPWRAPAR